MTKARLSERGKSFNLVTGGSENYIVSMKTVSTDYRIIALSAILPLLLTGMTGCGSSSVTESQSPSVIMVDDRGDNRDQALEHFIAGSTLESNGEHAKAIIEFQEALQYDDNAAIHYALAKNYTALEKPSLAAGHARRAVELEPENDHYRELLAEVFIDTYQIDSAIVQYEEIVRLRPGEPQALFTLANLYAPTKPLRALSLYNRLRDDSGDDWNVLYRISQLYVQLGMRDSAAAVMESMLMLDPGNVTLRTALAEMYMKDGKHERARAAYRDLNDRYPGNAGYLLALAEIERRDGNWGAAMKLYDSMLDLDTLDVNLKMEIGEAFFQYSLSDSTAVPHALHILQRLHYLYPRDWRPYWFMGAIEFNRGEMSDALSSLDSAIRLDSTNIRAYDLYARTSLSMGEYEKARSVLEKAVSLDENNAEILSLLGYTLNRLGLTEKSILVLERTLHLDPQNMEAVSTLALMFDGLKRFTVSDSLYEEALRQYERRKEKDATYYLLLNNYAYSLSERDMHLERALAMSRLAIEFEKENSSYLDTFGWIHYKLGDFNEAERYVLRAIEIRDAENEPGPTLFDHAGDIYFRMGEIEKARLYWKQALEQDTDNESIREKVKKGSL